MFEKFTDTITNQKQVDQTTLEKLKDIIPSAFKDGEFCLATFLQELNLENPSSERERERESYGFHWVGKEQAKQLANFDLQHKTLKPNFEKSLNWEDSNNIIIEGDNLEVLQILRKSYFNSIDVIYIDPPYNTGNDSFVYNDDFKQTLEEYKESLEDIENNYNWHTNSKNNGRFHTNWLNMIYPRLKIAHRLLKDDGVIFISIDDNEQARLKLLCDEIFGEQNFISMFTWNKLTTKSNSKIISNGLEYILWYGKNKEILGKKDWKVLDDKKINFLNKVNSTTDTQKKRDIIKDFFQKNNVTWNGYVNFDNLGVFRTDSLINRYESKTNLYSIINPINNKVINAPNRGWIWTKATFDEYLKKGLVGFSENGVYKKHYLDNYSTPTNYFALQSAFGGNDYKSIGLETNFSFPKPIKLIKYLINLNCKKNSLILDFFAGSGTTGQAVMELNKEDGGNRKYILVQINEQLEDQTEFETISDITRERIKRSIEKYDYKEKGFKFFEVCPTHFKNLDHKINLNENQQISFEDYINSIKPNTDLTDLIYEMILNLKLKLDIKLLKETITNHNVIIDESKSYLFILDSDNYNNVFDVINSVWQQKNGDGTLTVYLLENKLDDTIKTNLSEKIKCICSTNNIKIEVI